MGRLAETPENACSSPCNLLRPRRRWLLVSSPAVSFSLQLKGSLFDVLTLGTVEIDGATPPEIGDVVELDGKSYTITDLIHEDVAAYGLPKGEDEPHATWIAIVEPLAVSRRRGGGP
jgi:hypothetical protein